MDFEEWLGDRIETMSSHEYAAEKAAWDYQQKIIDDFKQANNDLAKAAIRPDGYVLVPVEPTEKMFKAGLGWRESDSELEGEYRMVYEAYKAMIQATQEEE